MIVLRGIRLIASVVVGMVAVVAIYTYGSAGVTSKECVSGNARFPVCLALRK